MWTLSSQINVSVSRWKQQFKASASQVSASALERKYGRYAVSFGEQRSRAGHPARRKALCASGRATDTTAYQCSTGLYLQSVGKAEYRHAKVIGFGSLSHRAGGAIASSVTMRPRESLRFVTEAHRHLSPVREAGCASQPQRRRTALAESHQMNACASQ